MFKNGVKTAVLLAGIGALFMLVGSFFGPSGLYLGLILGVVFVGGSYWFSDKLAVRAAGAKPVTEAEALTQEFTHASRPPRVGVSGK